MSALEGLYQELLLDHSKAKHGFGLAAVKLADEGESHQHNPVCGDEIRLRLTLSDDGATVSSLSWEGNGCSVSQASASMLVDLAPGMPVDEFSALIDTFRTTLRSRGQLELDEDLYGDAIALNGVSKYLARVKCAMLAWVAAEDALAQAKSAHAA